MHLCWGGWGGGGGVIWVPGHDYPTLAWPRHGHLPGGSTTRMAVTRVVVVRRELVVEEKDVTWQCLNCVTQFGQFPNLEKLLFTNSFGWGTVKSSR